MKVAELKIMELIVEHLAIAGLCDSFAVTGDEVILLDDSFVDDE